MTYIDFLVAQVRNNIVAENELITDVTNAMFERKLPTRSKEFRIITLIRDRLNKPFKPPVQLRIYQDSN